MLTQNGKLKGTGIYGFGITPGMTCVNCKIKCYAVRGMYNTFAKNCVTHWDDNLRKTQLNIFPHLMISEIGRKRKLTHVRVHTEGDFYNQRYLNEWAQIARWLPNVKFYAYTKALHLDFTVLPDNFKVIQSIGGEYDDKIDYGKPHARVFDSEDELNAAGYINCSKDDMLASMNGVNNIGLVFH